jgi:DNA-binding transcriptional regulator YiaG
VSQGDSITPAEVRKLKESLELTQEEFAKRIGAARETIVRWELGTAKPKGPYPAGVRKAESENRPK